MIWELLNRFFGLNKIKIEVKQEQYDSCIAFKNYKIIN